MKSAKNIEQSIKRLAVESSEKIHDRMIDKLQRMLDTSKKHTTIEQTSIWRIIMKSRMTKLATVTVVILAVVVGVILIDRSATPAYAVDQTIAAIQTIRTLHVRGTDNENGIDEKEYVEAWIKYDATGRMTNFRVDIYEGLVNEGGEAQYHAVWNNGVEKIWKPLENRLFIYRVNNAEERVQGLLNRYDPRFMQQKLHDAIRNKE
ncbi:hypothetical protein ACFL3Q_16375, partial [Planctomycetota bacterium]